MAFKLTMHCAEDASSLWLTCSCGWSTKSHAVRDHKQADRLAQTLVSWGLLHGEEEHADATAA